MYTYLSTYALRGVAYGLAGTPSEDASAIHQGGGRWHRQRTLGTETFGKAGPIRKGPDPDRDPGLDDPDGSIRGDHPGRPGWYSGDIIPDGNFRGHHPGNTNLPYCLTINYYCLRRF